MATLIGWGGHADDIAEFLDAPNRVGHHTQVRSLPALIGVNDPQLRAKIAAEMGVDDLAWVHPDAHLYQDVTFGAGTHINYGAQMVRTTIGDHCTISPGVTICGDVVIGDRCLIGAGATICNLVTIGDDVVVGAGAVVPPNTVIESGRTVVGVPAR